MKEPIAASDRHDTFPLMTPPSDLDRQFSALTLALMRASDDDPDIRSVRSRVVAHLAHLPDAPPTPLVEDLLIRASALLFGIHPRPDELLEHWDHDTVTTAIRAVTAALQQIR